MELFANLADIADLTDLAKFEKEPRINVSMARVLTRKNGGPGSPPFCELRTVYGTALTLMNCRGTPGAIGLV